MTIFLLEYEPKTGMIVSLTQYSEHERDAAMKQRLRLEKANALAGREREVALLEAVTESALRATHSRYFKSVKELADAASPGS